ncbi:MAG: dihydroorotate dehydrogenase electron transfer subunit, partial [Paramuribaculum sp.]|nr:dihydroorotate dehydrogenase electron transfer subunit [Paramuribaculum sp.]
MTKKEATDFMVSECRRLSEMYSLLILTPADGSALPAILPGQFVQVKVPHCADVMLRRPISINNVEPEKNTIWLLVRRAGKGTDT